MKVTVCFFSGAFACVYSTPPPQVLPEQTSSVFDALHTLLHECADKDVADKVYCRPTIDSDRELTSNNRNCPLQLAKYVMKLSLKVRVLARHGLLSSER